MDSCDLSILILNNNEPLTEEDKVLIDTLKTKKHIILINKIDLESKLDTSLIDEECLKISALQDKGIEELKQKIIKLFNLGELETEDLTYLSDARSISLLKQSLSYIDESLTSITNEEPIEMAEMSIKAAWDTLGEIIGETYKEELLDELFSRFCLGK